MGSGHVFGVSQAPTRTSEVLSAPYTNFGVSPILLPTSFNAEQPNSACPGRVFMRSALPLHLHKMRLTDI